MFGYPLFFLLGLLLVMNIRFGLLFQLLEVELPKQVVLLFKPADLFLFPRLLLFICFNYLFFLDFAFFQVDDWWLFLHLLFVFLLLFVFAFPTFLLFLCLWLGHYLLHPLHSDSHVIRAESRRSSLQM